MRLTPNPKFQAFDNDGDPLIGGKLYTYKAGTTTAQYSYSDMAGTPNTNPVILDSRGEATVFLNGAYKFILKTSADVTLWTLDNIKGADFNLIAYAGTDIAAAVAAAGATETTIMLDQRSTLAANLTVPSNVTLWVPLGGKIDVDDYTLTINGKVDAGFYEIFEFSGTGSVAGLREAYFEWFGAVGDGATDDSVYCQKTTDCLSTNNSKIIGKAGANYAVSALTPYSNQTWDMKGVTFTHNGAAGTNLINVYRAGVALKNFNLLGYPLLVARQSATDRTGALLFLRSAYEFNIEFLGQCGSTYTAGGTKYGNRGLHIYGRSGAGVYYGRVSCSTTGAYIAGCLIDGFDNPTNTCNDICFDNCKFSYNTLGLWIAGGEGIALLGGSAENNTSYGLHLDRASKIHPIGFWLEGNNSGAIQAYYNPTYTDWHKMSEFSGSVGVDIPDDQKAFWGKYNYGSQTNIGRNEYHFSPVYGLRSSPSSETFVTMQKISDWIANTAYILGQCVKATGLVKEAVFYECTTAGTSHATNEPSWDVTPGNTTADGIGTLVWTARATRYPRWQITASGEQQWGSGVAAVDATLSRSAANTLYTADQFQAADGLVTLIKAGAVGDGDFTVDSNGLIAIDSATGSGRLYFRHGGGWHYCSSDAGFQINAKDAFDYLKNPTAKFKPGDIICGLVTNILSDGAPHCEYVKLSTALKLMGFEPNITPEAKDKIQSKVAAAVGYNYVRVPVTLEEGTEIVEKVTADNEVVLKVQAKTGYILDDGQAYRLDLADWSGGDT